MPDALTLVVLSLGVVAALIVAVLVRMGSLARSRDAAAREAAELRIRLDGLTAANADFARDLRQELANARSEQGLATQTARIELGATLAQQAQTTHRQLAGMGVVQIEQMKHFGDRLAQLTQASEQRLDAVRLTVEQKLDALRLDNTQKLEQMRETVDEKLQTTLDSRLGESFKQVSERLEQVHKGLGEMQNLATGVGDLKRVLTNIKTRGTWGEVQLENLLEQMLIPSQYEKNVVTRPGRSERVEFAIRLPGRGDGREPFWLPIDAKFPLEDFQRLQDAQDRVDLAGIVLSGKALEDRVKKQARDIHEKYVEPPHTTDFALLYLPVESLYGEVLRRPGLVDTLQRDYQVTLAGPTTLAAILNSLQMGFRTLAIEQRSSEVRKLLGAVKTDFGKFGDLLSRTKKQLDSVSNTLGDAEVRTRSIERKLRSVEALPAAEAERLLSDEMGDLFEADPDTDVDADPLLPPPAGAG